MTRILTVSLVTPGDPSRLTGGYRYRRRMAKLAPASSTTSRFVCFPDHVGAENPVGAETWFASPKQVKSHFVV